MTGGASVLSPRQSSIAVLSCEAGRTVSAQDRMWFDGVANDVISQLARLRSFDAIARGSTFAPRDLASDAKRVGQRLGVDYVLTGSVVPRGDGFRLQLGALVDRITASVLTEVMTAERNRARLVPDQSLTAWQAYHRGLEAFGISGEPSLLRARLSDTSDRT